MKNIFKGLIFAIIVVLLGSIEPVNAQVGMSYDSIVQEVFILNPTTEWTIDDYGITCNQMIQGKNIIKTDLKKGIVVFFNNGEIIADSTQIETTELIPTLNRLMNISIREEFDRTGGHYILIEAESSYYEEYYTFLLYEKKYICLMIEEANGMKRIYSKYRGVPTQLLGL